MEESHHKHERSKQKIILLVAPRACLELMMGKSSRNSLWCDVSFVVSLKHNSEEPFKVRSWTLLEFQLTTQQLQKTMWLSSQNIATKKIILWDEFLLKIRSKQRVSSPYRSESNNFDVLERALRLIHSETKARHAEMMAEGFLFSWNNERDEETRHEAERGHKAMHASCWVYLKLSMNALYFKFAPAANERTL